MTILDENGYNPQLIMLARQQLGVIGETIGYGAAEQILHEQWGERLVKERLPRDSALHEAPVPEVLKLVHIEKCIQTMIARMPHGVGSEHKACQDLNRVKESLQHLLQEVYGALPPDMH